MNDLSKAGEWRLPDVAEMWSLTERGQNFDTLNSAGFINLQESWYWASGIRVTSVHGGSGGGESTDYATYVWPMRSGRFWSFDPLILQAYLDYDSPIVGPALIVREVTITNSNLDAPIFISISTTGVDAGFFTINLGGRNPCASLPLTLSEGQSCTVQVTCNPMFGGVKKAYFTVTANSVTGNVPITATVLATVYGNMSDQSTGLPVAGATVTLNTSATATTGSDGSYNLGNLPAATYSISVRKLGYQTTTKSNLTVTATTAAKEDILLPTTGALNITTTSLPWASPNIPFSKRIMVAGGTAPYTFSKAYGNLPAGLTLDTTTGTISGTPTGTGSYIFAIGVTDSVSAYGEKEFTIELLSPLQITTATLPSGQQGGPYSSSISATGGKPAYNFSLIAGTIPNGQNFGSNGALSGIPREFGTFNFTVRATDGTGRTFDKSYTLTIAAAASLTLNTTTLPQGYLGTYFSTTLSASGGVPPLTFSISETLPTGVSLNSSTCEIYGTPSAAGLTNLTFNVTDNAYLTAHTVSKAIPLRIWNALSISTTTIPVGTQKAAYSTTLTGIGGAAPHSWSIASGPLPQGILIGNITGALIGTPASCGSFPITARLTDSSTVPKSVDQPFTLTIACSNDYLITGNAGLAGATVTYIGPASGIVTADSGGAYRIGPLQNGTYTVTPSKPQCIFTPAVRTALVNNLDVSLAAFTGVLDTVAPTLSLSIPADKSITNNATLNVSGTVLDSNSGINSLTVNGASVAVATNGTFSLALTLVAGANTITAIATDNVNNQTTDTRTITLDLSAPILSVTAPADNSAVALSLVTVSGSVNENATVAIKVNNGASQALTVNGNDFTTSATLTVGLNTIDLTATDLAGNTSSAKRTITYDNTKPTLAVTLPAQDITTNQSTLTLQGTVSDTLSTVTVSITMDGQTFTPAVTNGAFQQQLTFATLKQYAIVVTATDQAGNVSTVQRNVIFDGLPGDVNGDKTVNVFDALQTLQYAVGLYQPTDAAAFKSSADVAPLDSNGKPKGDSVVNVFDALAILRHAVGLDAW